MPVTLKIRTGWDPSNRNGVTVARIAEGAGVQALAVHGRTRACRFEGEAEYATIAAIRQAVRIPVIANGDIDGAEKAARVIAATGADGVMIGRAAQGRPWLFREIGHFLATGQELPAPLTEEIRAVLAEHLRELYVFYGRGTGVRVARKHVAWYTKGLPGADTFRRTLNGLETCEAQLAAVDRYFGELAQQQERLRYEDKEELAA